MKTRLHLTVSPEVKRAAREVASRRGKSISQVVEDVISYLASEDKRKDRDKTAR
jgi:hypothetical protein